MSTRIKTEFAVMGLKPDGTWRTLGKCFSNAPSAQAYLGEYAANAGRWPDIFTSYKTYRIVKRTVTTTCTEWEEI